jgi:GTP-binding protein HflX
MQENAIIVGVNLNKNKTFEYEMEELENLAGACHIEVSAVMTQNLDSYHNATFVGTGKVSEIKEQVELRDANLVIFNDELSPTQVRNLEQLLDVKVIDRTILILDIFARRAKTKEAQLQVEIAQLRYMLPRLVGLGKSLNRQQGGIGSRGPGEKKLEVSRRRIQTNLSHLKKELDAVVKHRRVQREKRKKNDVPVVSIVGYTNAGKSTLTNTLLSKFGNEEKNVYVEDMVFATLETTSRLLEIEKNKKFIVTDTVGFVSNLPHHLVESFKSTLEEINESDLILHVIDKTNEDYKLQKQITEDVLTDIGVKNVPIFDVYNKVDKLNEEPFSNTDQDIYISALNDQGLDELIETVVKQLYPGLKEVTFQIPFDKGNIVSTLNELGKVLETDYNEFGTVIKCEVSEQLYKKYEDFIVEPE